MKILETLGYSYMNMSMMESIIEITTILTPLNPHMKMTEERRALSTENENAELLQCCLQLAARCEPIKSINSIVQSKSYVHKEKIQ